MVGNTERSTSGRWGPLVRGAALAAAACVVMACTAAGSIAGGASGSGVDQRGHQRGVTRRRLADVRPERVAYRVAPGLPPAGALSTAWTAHLDGAVYGQPLVAGSEVIAATEDDSIYALSAATGKVIWRKHVGTPVPRAKLHGCGNSSRSASPGRPPTTRATG